MVKRGRARNEDRDRSERYRSVARALLQTARDLELIGEPQYGNGLAIITVHAAIAYTDALTIAYRELRSTDGEHLQAAALLVDALGRDADADQVRRLRRILSSKSHASYSGSYYTLDEGRKILQELERFAAWAEDRLAGR